MDAEASARRSVGDGVRLIRGHVPSSLLVLATSTPALALIVVLITWQPLQVMPAAGFDPSWVTALTMATHRGLDWGTDLIFTYGPLGFLRFQLVMYGDLAVLSTVYVVVVRVGLAATVLWATRRTLSLPVAFIVAVVASLIAVADAVVVIVFLCCAAAIWEEPPKRAAPIVIYGGGVVGAIEALVKLNTGVLVFALCFVTVLVLEGSRLANVFRFLATFIAAFAALWFVAGQGIGNLDDYLRTAVDVISGYTGAMSSVVGRRWPAVAAVLLTFATLGAWMLAARRLPRSRAVGFVALAVMLAFIAWKEAFTRQDPSHVAFFFSWITAPWIALTWVRGWGRTAGLAGFAVAVVLFYAGTGIFPARHGFLQASLNPIGNAQAAVSDVYDLLDASRRRSEREHARQILVAQYQLDPKIRRMIGQQPIHVYPSEVSLAWAYGLNWDPVPAFQTATAYTPLQDHRNAAAISSEDGPRLILRQSTGSLDGRTPSYDTPAATLAMLCNFVPLRTTFDFQLLGRVADRCGAPREIASVTADYGQTLEVPRPPRPHDVVFARVSGLEPRGIEQLRAFLFRPTFRSLLLDGQWTDRLVPANAGDGLILSAPTSADFGSPRFESNTFSWKLAPRPNASTVAFEKGGGITSPDNRLRIGFYAMPVRPLP